MKTNKFNSSNLLLAVAVILLLGGIGIGTYYGINETNEINYLKDKSNTILDVLSNIETSSENVSLNNDGYKVDDLKAFEDDLHNSLKDSPIIHTYFEPEEINADTLYLYNDNENKVSTFSNIRLYSCKSSKFIDINVISNSSYIKTYDLKINLPNRLKLQHSTDSLNVGSGYYSAIRNNFYIYDKENNILNGFNSYISIKETAGKTDFEYYINYNTIVFSRYNVGKYTFEISLKDFDNVKPVYFELEITSTQWWPN